MDEFRKTRGGKSMKMVQKPAVPTFSPEPDLLKAVNLSRAPAGRPGDTKRKKRPSSGQETCISRNGKSASRTSDA